MAATNNVTSLADSGPGSFRAAISNATAGDTIVLSATGRIELTSGQLLISKNLNIVGPGPTNLAISGGGISRVFNNSNSTVNIFGVTIRDGQTADESGGARGTGAGIWNGGVLRASNCYFFANRTSDGLRFTGGYRNWGVSAPGGGAIYSSGVSLILSNCVFSSNNTGNGELGANGAIYPYPYPQNSFGVGEQGGNGGFGGAIYIAGGTSILANCVFNNNSTGDGGQGGNGGSAFFAYGGDGGNGGYGGAIFIAYIGIVEMRQCTIIENRTGFGGFGGLTGNGTAPGHNGATGPGGGGGGLWLGDSGRLTALSCLFASNACGNGGSGTLSIETSGNGGGAGNGRYFQTSSSQQYTISRFSNCTFQANSSGRGSAFLGGDGGGIFNSSTCIVSGCTFSGNLALDPNSGSGGAIGNIGVLTAVTSTFSGNSAYSFAGGLSAGELLNVVACTIVSNRVSTPSGNGFGGGIAGSVTNAFVKNCIIARNSASQNADVHRVTSQGHNFIGTGLTNPAVGDIISTNDPFLGPLADNGGHTLTHALLPGSPSLDSGDDTLAGFDQRGRPRSSGTHVDIGAYEYGIASPQLLTSVRLLANGSCQFTFTNLTDSGYKVLATTNIALPSAQWSDVGPAILVTNNLYEFIDPGASSNRNRFFQLRSQ